MTEVRVSDHAVLRYLERAHGLDVEAVRQHLAGLAVNGARLGAAAVIVERVKLVLRPSREDGGASTTLVTVWKANWPSRRPGE
jgi:hypothetical protein